MIARLLIAALFVSPAYSGDATESLARQVEREGIVAAVAQVQPPDRFEVLSSRFGGATPIDAEARLVPIETRGPNASGIVQIVFRMNVDGMPRGEARATVRGRVLGPALHAATTLKKGFVLNPIHLEVRENDLTRLTEPPLRDPAEALGRVPVRTLGRGRVMTASLVAEAPVVLRGERVDLRFDRPALNIVVSAIAQRNAAPGEVVPFRNIVTGVTIHGRVLPDGSALFVRR